MIKELQHFGLSEKEAKVYGATLELAQSTVQQISQKSGVNRATCYVQLESLKARGLVSQTAKGKKTLFIAEPPENVIKLIEKEKVDVLFKEKEFNKVLPNLLALYNLGKDRPDVRFYEGQDGVNSYREELMNEPPEKWYELTPFVDCKKFSNMDKKDEDSLISLYNKSKDVKVIYTGKERCLAAENLMKRAANVKMKFLSTDRLDLKTEVLIRDDKLWIAYLEPKPVGVVIDDAIITKSFENIFSLLWKIA